MPPGICQNQNFTRKLIRLTHVWRPDGAGCNDVVNGLANSVGVVIETKVSQHHAAAEKKGGGVRLVLALDVKTDVTASRLEDSNFTTHVASRHNSRTTDETSADV